MSASLEAIARRCFEREAERKREAKLKKREAKRKRKRLETGADADDQEFVGCVWSTVKFVAMWIFFGTLLGSGTLGFIATVATLVLIRVLPPRLQVSRHVSRRFAAFRAGRSDVVHDVYRFAVEEFRGQIEAHRARTLGSNSEWGNARESLARAVDDADRSMAYWRTRLQQDPDSPVVAGQLRTATELDAKLRSALGKLDGRADILRKFYNECHARVAVMDRYNRDIEETRRLERLSGTAGTLIAEAEGVLAGIGASFVREAQKVGEVLGDFERLQLKSLAGEAPLDDIEFLADRINESSEAEFATVEKLSRAIDDFAEPAGQ